MNTNLITDNFSLISGTIAVIVLFLFFKRYTKKNPGWSINKLLLDHTANVIKVIQTASTTGEVVTLMSVAMAAGRMGFGDALFRFGVMGIAEILLTIFFIEVFKSSLKKADKDGKLTIWEIIEITVKCTAVFIPALICTGAIFVSYQESINLLEIQLEPGDGIMQSLFGFQEIIIERDPNEFTDAMFDSEGYAYPAGRLEWSAFFMIYATPIFNLFLVLWEIFIRLREMTIAEIFAIDKIPGLFKKGKKGKTNNNTTSNNMVAKPGSRTTSLSKTIMIPDNNLKDYLKDIEEWFGLKEKEFVDWLGDYVGVNLVTGNDHVTTITDDDVKNGNKTPLETLDTISKRLLGKKGSRAATGILGIAELTDNINNKHSRIVKFEKDINDELKPLYAESDDDKKKAIRSRIRTKVKGFLGGLSSNLKDLEDIIKNRKNMKNDFSILISSLKYPSSISSSYTEDLESKVDAKVKDMRQFMQKVEDDIK